jgi:hypothetical protein
LAELSQTASHPSGKGGGAGRGQPAAAAAAPVDVETQPRLVPSPLVPPRRFAPAAAEGGQEGEDVAHDEQEESSEQGVPDDGLASCGDAVHLCEDSPSSGALQSHTIKNC